MEDTSSSVVHHRDYLDDREDQALCGVAFEKSTQLSPTVRPGAVCPDCEAKLAEYHVKWWRETAEAATAELDELRVRYRELSEYVDNQRPQVAGLPESRHEIEAEPQAAATGEQVETTPGSLLDQARKELVELCRPFDESIPYWRVKNSIDAFNEKLESDDRVRLANEIGADGSFTRWCVREIEGFGLQVTNSPVHGDPEDMMEAWTQDVRQSPKKTKWRMGRSR